MKTIRTLLAGLGLILLGPVALHAQSPLSLEIRGGVAVPMGDFADATTTGVGFGGTASFQILPIFDVYAGYSWTRFGAEDDGIFAGADDITDSGFAVGGRLYLAPVGNIAPWVQGGVLLHELETEGSLGGGASVSVTSDRDVGFEAGGGVTIPLTPNILLTPGVRYRQYPVQIDAEITEVEFDVQYLSVDLGVQIRP